MPQSLPRQTCSLAHPGTFGHECGAPAVLIAVFNSTVKPGTLFYTGRCQAHAHDKRAYENAGMLRLEPLGQPHQINTF